MKTMILFTIVVLISFIFKLDDLELTTWLNGVAMGVILMYWFILFMKNKK